MLSAPLSLRTLALISTAMVALSGTASAQGAPAPAACAGLAPDSAEAAILGCFRPAVPPTPVLPDREPAPEPLVPPAPEPIPEALRAPLPTPVPEPALEPEPEPLGDAAVVDLEPPPAPPARDDALVQIFADWLERHPIGSTVDPGEARRPESRNLPAGLPSLPVGLSYAEIDGMIVELNSETGEILRLVRRAPVLAEVLEPRLSVSEVSEADEEARETQDLARVQAEREAAERAEEEQEGEAAERARDAEEAEREAAERAEEQREREEEQAREAAERERDEEVRERDEDKDRRGEAQACDIPNGHLPPPGSCRVWFPDRPPGHQPPPTSCDVEVPAGAVLIRG